MVILQVRDDWRPDATIAVITFPSYDHMHDFLQHVSLPETWRTATLLNDD